MRHNASLPMCCDTVCIRNNNVIWRLTRETSQVKCSQLEFKKLLSNNYCLSKYVLVIYFALRDILLKF